MPVDLDYGYTLRYHDALRCKWLRTYLSCAYCGKLLSWRWKWCQDFDKHRLITGACQCERIGGHPRVNPHADQSREAVVRIDLR